MNTDTEARGGSPLRALERHYQQLYSSEADRYDAIRYAPPKGQRRNHAEQQTLFDLLGPRPGAQVLDAPAGTGRIATFLAEQGVHVTALDITEAMLREARGQAQAGAPIRFVVGNGRLLPFAEESFDAAVAIRFFHLLPVAMHRPFLLELWRVLRPGGVLVAQFTSALTLGGVAWPHEWYRRALAGRKPRHYLWPQQVAALFEGMARPTFHSTAPDVTALPRPVAQGLHRLAGQGRSRFFLNRRLFVRAIKPADLRP